MNPFDPTSAVLAARLQAWCVCLLSILVDAYQLGAVIGKGASVQVGGDTLQPDVMFIPAEDHQIVAADVVRGAPQLAIDLIPSRMPEAERASLRARYATIHVLEYWQVEVDRARPAFYQASASWTYDLIPPDKAGVHFSIALVELSFPVQWFQRQPDLFTMMSYWDLISDR